MNAPTHRFVDVNGKKMTPRSNKPYMVLKTEVVIESYQDRRADHVVFTHTVAR